MASPLLIAAMCMGKRQRKFFLFCFAGMGACLLSAYINTFFVALYKAARERFFVFCSTDVAMSLFKLFFTYLLIDHFEHKLIIYTCVMAFMTAFPTVVFFAYCRRQFAAITRFVFVREWRKYGINIGFHTFN